MYRSLLLDIIRSLLLDIGSLLLDIGSLLLDIGSLLLDRAYLRRYGAMRTNARRTPACARRNRT